MATTAGVWKSMQNLEKQLKEMTGGGLQQKPENSIGSSQSGGQQRYGLDRRGGGTMNSGGRKK